MRLTLISFAVGASVLLGALAPTFVSTSASAYYYHHRHYPSRYGNYYHHGHYYRHRGYYHHRYW
jgi:hypothetical protein